MQTHAIAEGAGVRTSDLMRQVNVNLRGLSAESDAAHPIGFFCECIADECYAVVWLNAAAFETHVAQTNGGWLLAAGHEASPDIIPAPEVSVEVAREHGRRSLSAAFAAVNA